MIPIGNHFPGKAGFADLYLDRYGSAPVADWPGPDPDLFMIVAIPAYNEPGLVRSIQSLLDCEPPGVKWEILVNVNYPEGSDPAVREQCLRSYDEVAGMGAGNLRPDVAIRGLWQPEVPSRKAGVGLARKILMDEAVRRFNRIGRPGGILVSFDADSTCSRNYLKAIAGTFWRRQGIRTANIRFEHPLDGDPEQAFRIAGYELYLRYMKLALEWTGHPHSIHTVGSSFAVRAKNYVKVNGMGTQKAGEDFYFLHKCARLGNFWEINEAAVFPSARESDRVSFGTGATMRQLKEGSGAMEVYRFKRFRPLKDLFAGIGGMWEQLEGSGGRWTIPFSADKMMEEFLLESDGVMTMERLFRDSGSPADFRKKFFEWFDAFMVLKYLNFSHRGSQERSPVNLEASSLASLIGITGSESVAGLLSNYREFEKSRGTWKVI